MTTKVNRINHFPEIMRKNGWDREEAIRQLQYHARLSRPTAAKFADGRTDMDLISIEKISKWLGISKDALLETK